MYAQLKEINHKPEPFEFYTADSLWADPHTSEQMLAYHLNENVDIASRKRVFIESSVNWIASHFSIDEQTRVCDFGCGPGLYTSGLARKDAHVTGVDFSERSIVYARKSARQAGLNIYYVLQNYLEYEPEEQYDLIIMIMCDFCALSPVQRKALLEKFHRLLKDGGCLLMDVYSFYGFEDRSEVSLYEHMQLHGFWSKDDYYGFMNTFKYEEEKVVLDKYTIIEDQKSRVIYNWLQYFSAEMLRSDLQSSGFKIQGLYGDVAGSEYSKHGTEFAVIAEKE
jgi:SAM-dependent methyltransferase